MEEQKAWEQLQLLNKKSKIANTIGLLGVAIFVVGFFILFFGDTSLTGALILLALIIVAVAGFVLKGKFVKASNALVWDTLKDFINSNYSSKLGEREDYTAGRIEEFVNCVKESYLYDDFNRQIFSIARKVTYKGTVINSGNLDLIKEYEVEDGDGDTTTEREYVFRGIWIFFDVTKDSVDEDILNKVIFNINSLTQGKTLFGIIDGKAHFAITTSHLISVYNKSFDKNIKCFDDLKAEILKEMDYEKAIYDEALKILS